MAKQASELLRGEDVGSFGVWSLPSFDDVQGHVVEVDHEAESQEQSAPEPCEEPAQVHSEVVDEAPQPLTLEQLEAISQEAFQEGYSAGEAEGYAAGQARAEAEYQQRLADMQQRLELIMQQLLAPIAEQDQAIEQALLNTVKQVSEAVIRRELTIDSRQIAHVLREALKALPMGAEHVRIYLHPQDMDTIKALRARHDEQWKLLEDDALLPGGCRIEAGHSLIDASVDRRLEQIMQQLDQQAQAQRAHAGEPDVLIDLDELPPAPLAEQAMPRELEATVGETVAESWTQPMLDEPACDEVFAPAAAAEPAEAAQAAPQGETEDTEAPADGEERNEQADGLAQALREQSAGAVRQPTGENDED